jgi:hypothetical protein
MTLADLVYELALTISFLDEAKILSCLSIAKENVLE